MQMDTKIKHPAIICDLDGTLALFKNKGHRGPFDATRCDEDEINMPVLKILERMRDSHCIIFLSGRESKFLAPTLKFLNKCGFDGDKEPFFLFMRQTGDKRKDCIIKRELFDAHVAPIFEVFFVLDDRNQVVQMWREMGLTCFQVADGDF